MESGLDLYIVQYMREIKTLNFIKRNSVLFTIYGICLFFLFSLVACEKDNKVLDEEGIETNSCADLELEHFLLNDSFISIPYTREKSLLFIDSLNNEIVFDFFQKERLFYTTQGKINCEFDNSIKINVTAKIDTYEFYLVTNSNFIDREFLISLRATLGIHNDISYIYDVLNVIAFPKNGGNSLSALTIQVNQRDNFYIKEDNNFHDSTIGVTLNGKVFYNVYYDNYRNDIYYNYEFGLIAFRDNSNKLWVLKN